MVWRLLFLYISTASLGPSPELGLQAAWRPGYGLRRALP